MYSITIKHEKIVFFAYIANKTICLMCSYKPFSVKKFIIEKYYTSEHFKEYSNYMNPDKFNIIEELKLYHESIS